ncbi:ribosome biogenesis protein WDR12 homolog [Brassica rapa]|uniref:ribosome biogenesis protein WDR12 homolog n=1 Tax=Brassica campestris TaxID=3711 RepID=UPI00142E33C4|nr:ribosome biogenesis protein WDR12 homolog [Brassica rapa]
MNGEGEDASKVIHVKFIKKLDAPFKVLVTSFVIPSSVTRLGLSSIVNSLLTLEKPELFDFLIDGELIPMSLEQFLDAKGISGEMTLEIEYIRVVASKVDTAESGDTTTRLDAYKILRGHKASVESLLGWDCTINVWDTNESTSELSVPGKKRKGNNQAEEPQLEGEAETTLVGHTQCVSLVVWPEHDVDSC